MTDTIASLKRELKILGPVDYSTNTRQQREMILGQIAELEWAARTPEEIAARNAHMFVLEARVADRNSQIESNEKGRIAELLSNIDRDADRHAAKLERKGLTTCGKKSCPHRCNKVEEATV